MKAFIDTPKVQRRARVAHIASLGGLIILLGSVALSLWRPDSILLSGLLIFIGGATSMVGIYFANRWVKKPRPEEILDKALRGLSDQHRLYHYTPYGDHLLLTPNGVVVLETVNLEGQFRYQDGKWKQKLTMGRALRYIVEEKLGNPSQQAQQQARYLETYLVEGLEGTLKLPVDALVVFTHPLATVEARKSPLPVVQPDKLTKKVPHPGNKLPPDAYSHLRSRLDALFETPD